MKKLLLLRAAFAVLTSCNPVFAADLPAKAAPMAIRDLNLNANGLYFGLWSTGGMSSIQGSALQVNPGVNPNSIVATEAAIGGLIGYHWAMPSCATCFLEVEGMFGWQNINGATPGFAFSGPAVFKQRVLYGADTATIAQLFPTLFPFPVPGFPASIGNITNIKPYIYASADEDDISINVGGSANRTWSLSPEIGVGALGQISASTVIDVFAGAKFPQKGACVGFEAAQACAGLGTTAVVGLALKF